ncbi:PAS domain S-box protein [Bacillus salipaludis]|uniref:HTH-type transcriptional regulatory protein TyrR n=1 Tax=Bacillus salipaludis TaxID=2547811 RepID=A0A4R5VY63_9BACI|nr:sigma 54-interacting transcriptional regulator [Bacillus salipaludis]TDK64211.1 PAS domain S-box protein [Bacillus salipaludis]
MIKFKTALPLRTFKGQLCKNLKQFLDVSNFLYILVDSQEGVQGIVDEMSFWKHVAVKGWESEISGCFNDRFIMIENEEMLISEAGTNPDVEYFILRDSLDVYRVYSSLEIETTALRQHNNSLLNNVDLLNREMDSLRQQVNQLKCILDSSYDEIFVTDGQGNTLFVSEISKKITGFPPELFIGKNVRELVNQGLVENSVSLEVIKTKKIVSRQQTYTNGTTVLATGKPVFNDKGEISLIIINSRDISELVKLRNQIAYANSVIDRQKQLLSDFQSNPLLERLNTRSEKMFSIIELIEKVSPTDSSVLIEGESGVGKNLLARLIHDKSRRNDRNFVQINCGAISPSLIEAELFGYEPGSFTGANKSGKIGLVKQADGGTLFLDEIGELPMDLQVKLLQLVQEKTFIPVGGTKEIKVDIRIISATNKNLKQRVKDNLFREDLYYRLYVVPITVPPLRERVEDITLLIEYFLKKFNDKYEHSIMIDDEAINLLNGYEWGGNVRELENLIEQLIVTARGAVIYEIDLPSYIVKTQEKTTPRVTVSGILPLKIAVEETERQLLKRAQEKYKTSRKMARILEVNQTTIIRKTHKYNLNLSNEEEFSGL